MRLTNSSKRTLNPSGASFDINVAVIAEKIVTEHQRADVFAKALPCDTFGHLQSKISGWQCFVRECHEHKIQDGIHKFLQANRVNSRHTCLVHNEKINLD